MGSGIKRRILLLIFCFGAAAVIWFKPSDIGGPYPKKFAMWNERLRRQSLGGDVAILDLDAVDRNIELVRKKVDRRFALRLVTKSLPSKNLIRYLMDKLDTTRLMVFSERNLVTLLGLEEPIDIMLGVPLPVATAHKILKSKPLAEQVKWLIDTPRRLNEYLAVALQMDIKLNIVIEIDVGLRKGGVESHKELCKLLQIITENPQELSFCGLMGYDGHVPFAPFFISEDGEFQEVHERYKQMVKASRSAFPRIFHSGLVFNSGGSRTYVRYDASLVNTPVNDIALGSVFLAPNSFDELINIGHRPASFLASVVLKKKTRGKTSFVESIQDVMAIWNPNLRVSYHLQRGGFPGKVIAPPGLVDNPLIRRSSGIRGLFCNQQLLCGSTSIRLEEGDFVFFHPWEADGLLWLDNIHVFRGSSLLDQWKTI